MNHNPYADIISQNIKDRADRDAIKQAQTLKEKSEKAERLAHIKELLTAHVVPEFTQACAAAEQYSLFSECSFTENPLATTTDCTLVLTIKQGTLTAICANPHTVHFTLGNLEGSYFNTLPSWNSEKTLSLTQHTVQLVQQFVARQS